MKIRVLQITGGFRKGVSGGIASVLNNYCTAETMTTGEIAFDYLSLGYQTFEPYRENLELNGGNLYSLDIHTTGLKQLFDIYKGIRKFLNENSYDIVHANSGALTQLLVMCMAAKSKGIKTVIAHAHNALEKTRFKQFLYNCLKPMFYLAADHYFACALLAAKSIFPKGIIKKNSWVYIPNAIKLERFLYDKEIRDKYRNELGVQDKFVIGHVGRFNTQKNHQFIIEVFEEVSRQREDAVLLLVGTGDLVDEIKNAVRERHLDDKVIFAGQRSDANNLMQAMDYFVFPSKFEGLGMVLIEAQVSGLTVLASNKVPLEETNITDQIQYLPFEKQKWVNTILSGAKKERRSDLERIYASGYELNSAADRLKRFYIERT